MPPRKLDTSMLDGGDTPRPDGSRPTPLAHKVLDRVLHKRERCEKHCQCVTQMKVKVSAMFYVFLLVAGYLIRSEIAAWQSMRALGESRPPVTSSGASTALDRVAQPDAGRP